MRARVVFLATALLFCFANAHGDGGLIPFQPKVKVFEPNQNALIAWDGQEEILILSTDTHASVPTKALEVIPMRSEPAVKEADPEIFAKAQRLIDENRLRQDPPAMPAGPPGAGPPTMGAPPAGKVTLHERIGRHDIAVTHVLSASGFNSWAEDYLRSQGADTPTIPPRISKAVQGYLDKGFRWFVYDVVELGASVRTNEPIQFRFKSDCVFYPLAITQTESPKVKVRILLITPKYLTEYPELPRDHIRVGLEEAPGASSIAQETVILGQRDLLDLGPDIDSLFDHREGMKLRIWTLLPELMRGRFTHDLVAR